MFDIYQHKLNPAYRLIVACKAELPQEANKADWDLTRIGVRKVASEAEESVQNVGYHLYKPVSTFAPSLKLHSASRPVSRRLDDFSDAVALPPELPPASPMRTASPDAPDIPEFLRPAGEVSATPVRSTNIRSSSRASKRPGHL